MLIGKVRHNTAFVGLLDLREDEIAATALEMFGANAGLAVAFSAIDARLAGRDGDFHFWTRVFNLLTEEITP